MQQHQIILLSLLIPFFGMALGGIVVYLSLKHDRETRELLNRERLAAIEKGLDVPLFDIREPKQRTSPLYSALVVLACGIALSLPVVRYGPGAWMWGFLLALIGLAKLVHWFVGGKQEWERQSALDEELRRAYIDRLRSGTRVISPLPDGRDAG